MNNKINSLNITAETRWQQLISAPIWRRQITCRASLGMMERRREQRKELWVLVASARPVGRGRTPSQISRGWRSGRGLETDPSMLAMDRGRTDALHTVHHIVVQLVFRIAYRRPEETQRSPSIDTSRTGRRGHSASLRLEVQRLLCDPDSSREAWLPAPAPALATSCGMRLRDRRETTCTPSSWRRCHGEPSTRP